jgi:uncharacterized protein (TIGR03437 family)
VIAGNIHHQAQPQDDRGAVDPSMHMDYMVLVAKPSAAQQTELDGLLADQQNPSSPYFHQWLTPEEFGSRFGLSTSDHSKLVAWLTSEGFKVNESARGRNWVAFSGTANQVSKSLHTPIHRFHVDGETHFANSGDPSVPEALADVVWGFLGLDDFYPRSYAYPVPDYNVGTSHFLVPEDFATIYDIAPLYKAGIDGTGQKIAVVGQSEVALSDIRAFRTRYNLPPNDPQFIPYTGASPGFNGAQVEGNLDLEWSGAIAPNATIYYVYGPSAFTAIMQAVNLNVAPIISISYGTCEINAAPSFYRSIAQQGNAQGITLVAASGDSGAAGCDPQGVAAFAARGRSVTFPGVMPEVTGVGGTQFVEGTGTYWATTNSANFGSALSYIPEAAWNESTTSLLSTGGGASVFYSRPPWQNGPGVPSDNVRYVPDVSLSAAGHDAYEINVSGTNGGVSGTSCSAPSMAGILALLNQYQVSKGFQKLPGLGNINPQLYRLAQSAPSAFHDVTAGDNIVACSQASPDCLAGSFGYKTGPAYDLATGLGSVDANNLVTLWNTTTRGVTVVLSMSTARTNLNDSIALTAGVDPVAGSGTPTGTVTFSSGSLPLGSAPLTSRNGEQVADLYFPAYLLEGTGTFTIAAQYSGDAAFSSAGTTRTLRIDPPTGAAGIIISWPNTIWPAPMDAQGLSWLTTITVSEVAGVPAVITGLSIDGKAQTLADYFPSPNIAASTSSSITFVFRNLAAPVTRIFAVTGIDVNGNTWSREFLVNYNPAFPSTFFNLSATPLTVTQNTAADPSCQWQVQLNVDDVKGGVRDLVSSLFAGQVSLSSKISSIFGTGRLDSWSSLQGTLCFSGITPPATNSIQLGISGLTNEVNVSFAGPPQNPTKVTASPANVSLAAASSSQTTRATLAVDIADKTQSWTASIFPGNRTTAWLTASQYSGTGPGQITLTASGTGFEPGAYRATVVLQSANAVPQYITVPVMFVLGGSTSGTSISSVANSFSSQTTGSPGMLLSVFGSKLANSTQTVTGTILPYSVAGVSATVNNIAAPLLYVSPTQLNIQIPYEVGSGPAVLSINNNGQIAGFLFQMAATAPGIFADANGNLAPNDSVQQGANGTFYLTGAGEVATLLLDGRTPSAATPPANLPKPSQPLSVTVGGTPVFVRSYGLAPGQFGVMVVNFVVPASVPTGRQPVVVTVGGASSPPVNVTVQAAATTGMSVLESGRR